MGRMARLIVVDAPGHEGLVEALRRRGHAVDAAPAADPAELASRKPDLVIVNVLAPGGAELARSLREGQGAPSLAIAIADGDVPGAAGAERVVKLAELAEPSLLSEIELRAGPGAQRPTRIVLADDEPGILFMIRELLQASGYEVRTANDGQEALDEIRKDVPDIVVIDYQMPRKNGIEVCAELKSDPRFEYLPLIILSGTAQRDTRVAGLDLGADDYIAKPVDASELLARIRMIVKRTQGVLAANPLTHLPGNVTIETTIQDKLAQGGPMDVLYIDINHFKSYNDAYGFRAGDNVIKAAADLLVRVVRAASKDFIGHIGGDDFIVVTTPDRSEAMCQDILREFDRLAPSFYAQEDRERGYIMSTDRQGQMQRFPLLSLAIGVVTNRQRRLQSLGQVSQIGAEVKKKAKLMGASQFYVDRRKD